MKKKSETLLSSETIVLCYVCNRKIKSGQGVYVGQSRYRHHCCAPGTSMWLKSEHGLKSKYREIWLKARAYGKAQ